VINKIHDMNFNEFLKKDEFRCVDNFFYLDKKTLLGINISINVICDMDRPCLGTE